MVIKTIDVVAAVIRNVNRVYATQRGYGEFKDGWEFPGGKVKEGETPQQALRREIREELAAEIKVGGLIDTVDMNYPEFHLHMQVFWANVSAGRLTLLEHEAARWVTGEELDKVAWLPADRKVVPKIREELERTERKLGM